MASWGLNPLGISMDSIEMVRSYIVKICGNNDMDFVGFSTFIVLSLLKIWYSWSFLYTPSLERLRNLKLFGLNIFLF